MVDDEAMERVLVVAVMGTVEVVDEVVDCWSGKVVTLAVLDWKDRQRVRCASHLSMLSSAVWVALLAALSLALAAQSLTCTSQVRVAASMKVGWQGG